MEKLCRNCGWSVFRGQGPEEGIIADDGISEMYLCRKLNLKVYGKDRACPLFTLADEHYQQPREE